MILDKYQTYYFDHDKLRRKVKAILIENDLKAEDIATSIGYANVSLTNYLLCKGDSRFIAGALLERFNLNPRDFMRDN